MACFSAFRNSFYHSMLSLLQDKQKTKVKEKFDKCNKEKLLEFCDLLNLPISKATTRKVC